MYLLQPGSRSDSPSACKIRKGRLVHLARGGGGGVFLGMVGGVSGTHLCHCHVGAVLVEASADKSAPERMWQRMATDTLPWGAGKQARRPGSSKTPPKKRRRPTGCCSAMSSRARPCGWGRHLPSTARGYCKRVQRLLGTHVRGRLTAMRSDWLTRHLAGPRSKEAVGRVGRKLRHEGGVLASTDPRWSLAGPSSRITTTRRRKKTSEGIQQ
ncbi:hypothetical protein LZ30DRAFT_728974 [Colletotrichum cereale]|nr:hypothetical protein LZ30DRAFT_728974 [Colletotrichum cereale]